MSSLAEREICVAEDVSSAGREDTADCDKALWLRDRTQEPEVSVNISPEVAKSSEAAISRLSRSWLKVGLEPTVSGIDRRACKT